MRRNLKILISACLVGSLKLAAQPVPSGPMPAMHVTGRLLEASTGKPLMFASVLLTPVNQPDKTEGTFSDTLGVYEFKNITPGRYVRVISAIGFSTTQDTILLRPAPGGKLSLPDLRISSGIQLGEVSVVEERDPIELKVDRLVFNIGNDLTAQSGSVLDAMRNIPLLSVDVDDKITLRGSENFVVYINGKPSGFTVENRNQILSQIPASTIERIELITNPSAKYEAEGMAGILNIVTKQNREKGQFGSFQLGGGWPATANASLNYNYTSGKWSFSSTLGFRHHERNRESFSDRTIYLPGGDSIVQRQDSESPSRNTGGSLSGNIDYKYHPEGSLGLTYMLGARHNDDPEHIHYDFRDGLLNPTRNFERETFSKRSGFNSDIGLNWQQKDKDGNGEWTAGASISFNNDRNRGDYLEWDYFPDSLLIRSRNNRTRNNRNLTIQLDRVQPLRENWKLETGVRSGSRRQENTLLADSLNPITQEWFVDTLLTNDFTYNEWVNAAYLMVSGKLSKKLEAQAGVRAEHTWANGTARGVEAFDKTYLNFFPSVQAKYAINDENSLALSYSRRINRPSFWALNPFPDYSDPFNLRVGDPTVNPEITDNFELSYTRNFKAGHFLYASAFWRETHDPFQHYITIDSNGVSTVRTINFGAARNYGADIVLRLKLMRQLNLTLNGSFFRNEVEAGNLMTDLSSQSWGANVRSTLNYKFLQKNDIQLNFNYRAPMRLPQGKMYEFTWVDIAFKREILQGKANITFSVSDIFNTRRFRFLPDNSQFSGEVYRKRQSQIFTVQFTWKFGNPGKEVPSKRTRSGGDDGGGGGDMEMGL